MPTFRPGKPYRLASLSADTAVAVGDSTIPFNTFVSDGEFGPTTSGGRVEIAVAGLYVVTLAGRRVTPSASAALAVTVLHDGVPVARDTGPVAANAIAAAASYCWQMAVGAIILGQVSLGLAASLEADSTRMAVVRIGPVRWT